MEAIGVEGGGRLGARRRLVAMLTMGTMNARERAMVRGSRAAHSGRLR